MFRQSMTLFNDCSMTLFNQSDPGMIRPYKHGGDKQGGQSLDKQRLIILLIITSWTGVKIQTQTGLGSDNTQELMFLQA